MKKSYGQHFLKDQSVIEKIIKSADLCSGDFVVEVGPGDGALTHQITCLIGPTSPTGLILIEADSDLLPNLRAQFISAQLIHADAAQVNIDEIVRDKPWIFISNLPYNSANAILMNMLTAQNPPERSVVMVQKEVGEKMLAKPGDMSLLSVAVQMYTNPTRVCTVKPGSFNPSPKVDSVVLRLDKKQVVENAEEIKELYINKERISTYYFDKTNEELEIKIKGSPKRKIEIPKREIIKPKPSLKPESKKSKRQIRKSKRIF